MRYKIYALLREFLDYESHEGRKNPMFPRKLLKKFEYESKKGKKYKVERTAPPTILHLEEVKAALKLASTFKVKRGEPGEWLAIFVLGTYCGLRPHEIQALGRIQRGGTIKKGINKLGPEYEKLGSEAVWKKHIQLNRGVIVCDDKIGTKNGERRNVKLRPNVLKWLKYIKQNELPLCVCDRRFARYAKYFRIAVMDERRQGDKLWDDVFRHTFATFLWNAKGMIESEYCLQMGHSLKVAKQNYLGDLYDTENSEEFFSITPSSVFGTKSNRS